MRDTDDEDVSVPEELENETRLREQLAAVTEDAKQWMTRWHIEKEDRCKAVDEATYWSKEARDLQKRLVQCESRIDTLVCVIDLIVRKDRANE